MNRKNKHNKTFEVKMLLPEQTLLKTQLTASGKTSAALNLPSNTQKSNKNFCLQA